MQNTAECFGPACVGCNPPRRQQSLCPLCLKRDEQRTSPARPRPTRPTRCANRRQQPPSRVRRRRWPEKDPRGPVIAIAGPRVGPVCYIACVPNVVSTGSSEISSGSVVKRSSVLHTPSGAEYGTIRHGTCPTRPCPGAHNSPASSDHKATTKD